MLTFLADPEFGPTWASYGGGPTLASYGVAAPTGRQPEAWAEARDALTKAVPAHQLRFLNALEPSVEYGDYIFVHAGLRPGVALEDQTEQDKLWIRDEFLQERRPFAKIVVHGHSPEAEPVMNAVRIGLDTGAYATGVLTAARLYGFERSVIQTRED
jgi:serine/threonine protein phosphatase 1